MRTSVCQLSHVGDDGFPVVQLRRGFPESESELQDREGAVTAASLLRMWRYARPLKLLITLNKSGRED